MDTHRQVVRAGYERMAPDYLAARTYGDDLAALEGLLGVLPARGRVLDAGCGAGRPIADRLTAAGLEVVGLDFSPAQLALARRRLPAAHLVEADLVSLPFRSCAFHAVVSYYTIIHVPRALHASVFAEVRRVLTHPGYALLCLGLSDVAVNHDRESWLGVEMFWSHFDEDTNLGLLDDAGLAVAWHRRVDDPMGHGQHLFVLAVA